MKVTITPQQAYELGFDCGKNGSTLENCSYLIFLSPENREQWEKGKSDGEAQKPPPKPSKPKTPLYIYVS